MSGEAQHRRLLLAGVLGALAGLGAALSLGRHTAGGDLAWRAQQLLPDGEVVRQVLHADANHDSVREYLVFAHDWSDHGFPASLKLYVVVAGTRGRRIARKVLLFEDARLVGRPRLVHLTGTDALHIVASIERPTRAGMVVVELQGQGFLPVVLYRGWADSVGLVPPTRRGGTWAIAERWMVWHLDGDVPENLAGHVLARRLYRWDRTTGRYVPGDLEPDTEAEHSLAPGQLRHVPGHDALTRGDL